jgi:hypothetical protein
MFFVMQNSKVRMEEDWRGLRSGEMGVGGLLVEGLGESGSPVALLELLHHHLTADASSNGPTLILHDLQYHLQLDVMPSSHHLASYWLPGRQKW